MYARLVAPGTAIMVTPLAACQIGNGQCYPWGSTPPGDCHNGITPQSGLCYKGITDH